MLETLAAASFVVSVNTTRQGISNCHPAVQFAWSGEYRPCKAPPEVAALFSANEHSPAPAVESCGPLPSMPYLIRSPRDATVSDVMSVHSVSPSSMTSTAIEQDAPITPPAAAQTQPLLSPPP